MERNTKSTVASGVVALALLAGCGDEVAAQSDRSPSSPHVEYQRLADAERIEHEAHLDGQWWTYMGRPRPTHEVSESVPGSRHMPTS